MVVAGLPTTVLAALAVGVLVGAGLAVAVLGRDDDPDRDWELYDDDGDRKDVVELDPPIVRDGGLLVELWRTWRYLRKRKKLVQEGYVQWFLVDDGWPRPTYVKPKERGGGILEVEHDGTRYLFPRGGMIPDETSGIWTIVHQKGDAEPLNVQAPSEFAIPPDELEEYLSMRPTASPPSFWDKLDIDSKDAVRYAVFALIALALLQTVLGGA